MLSSFFKTIGLLFLLIAFSIYFDSSHFIKFNENGQHIVSIMMLVVFCWIFYKVGSRYKEQMIYAVLIGIAGEYLFSIVFGMYAYRLGNIPHYVPIGHAIVYIATVKFVKQGPIIENKDIIEKIFRIFIFIYSAVFLIFRQDVYGFILTLLSLYLLRNKPRERLFYYAMYLVVVFLELVGTSYQAWYWPPIAFDKFEFLPSANPPAGISFFYFGLDLGCLWLYKKRHQLAWSRMKHIRYLREAKQSL